MLLSLGLGDFVQTQLINKVLYVPDNISGSDAALLRELDLSDENADAGSSVYIVFEAPQNARAFAAGWIIYGGDTIHISNLLYEARYKDPEWQRSILKGVEDAADILLREHRTERLVPLLELEEGELFEIVKRKIVNSVREACGADDLCLAEDDKETYFSILYALKILAEEDRPEITEILAGTTERLWAAGNRDRFSGWLVILSHISSISPASLEHITPEQASAALDSLLNRKDWDGASVLINLAQEEANSNFREAVTPDHARRFFDVLIAAGNFPLAASMLENVSMLELNGDISARQFSQVAAALNMADSMTFCYGITGLLAGLKASPHLPQMSPENYRAAAENRLRDGDIKSFSLFLSMLEDEGISAKIVDNPVSFRAALNSPKLAELFIKKAEQALGENPSPNISGAIAEIIGIVFSSKGYNHWRNRLSKIAPAHPQFPLAG